MLARDEWSASGRFVAFGAAPEPYEVFVRESGVAQGEAIFFLQGFDASSWEWAKLEPHLADRYRLGYVDFLGTGESSDPPRRRYSFLEQAHVARAALDTLGFDRFHLVAHAHGVSIAQQFLCEAALRARIASLTILNGAAYGDPQPEPFEGTGDGEGDGNVPAVAEPGPPSLGRRLARRMRLPESLRGLLGPLGASRGPRPLAAANGGRKVSQRLARYAAERAEFGPMWESALEEALVPLCVIWGMRDAEDGPAILARVVAGQKRFPNVTTLPDAGARPHVEASDRVAASLAAFVFSLAAMPAGPSANLSPR
jgi:pimeloyl-ACP methyl ester carboxylesterase